MDIDKLHRCIERCELLLRGLDENKDDIRSCTGERVAQVYTQVMDLAEGQVRQTRDDLRDLLYANGG